jgi:hypothetical protein
MYFTISVTIILLASAVLSVRRFYFGLDDRKLLLVPYWLMIAIVKFCAFCFDLYPPLKKADSDPPRPSKWDRIRMLHLSWHGVVYVPVIVVSVVAKVLGAGWHDIVFFASVALATVALETCVGVIIGKANEIEDLSRQTRRAIKLGDVSGVPAWVEYFVLRHQTAKVGIAKAAIVTVVSIVLFSTIVGVEVIRMISHSMERTVDRFVESCCDLGIVSEIPKDQRTALLKKMNEHDPAQDTNLLFLAITLCLTMILIAMSKVWAQTRSCLREHDAMDYFPNGGEAKKDFERDPYFHMCGEDSP